MPTPPPIEYADASPQVRVVFDDIKKTRGVPDVNNFWKYLARDPVTLKRTWESVKEVMAAGRAGARRQGNGLSRGFSDQWLCLLHRKPYRCRPQGGDDGEHVRRADGGHRNGQ